MDSNCDYLVYRQGDTSEKQIAAGGECLHCSEFDIREETRSCTVATPAMPAERASEGRMAPYVELIEATHPGGKTRLCYVKDGVLITFDGAIHMRDVTENGTWLSTKAECTQSLLRLRLASLTCIHLPELNRIVLEQKNDDGLLELTNKWLWNKENLGEGIEVFGAFVCDAMLAPVLHAILRSDWIEKRKELGETNNELKLGWAQEFYDWRCLTRTETGSAVFAHNPTCEVAHSYATVRLILGKMRRSGYTPWSAVQAVRCTEVRIGKICCVNCTSLLLSSCVFLMECAAVEASRQRDWLVRNEAVIQLCWLLYHIHEPGGCASDNLLAAWAESTVIHSIKFQQYRQTRDLDVESLVVMFANDHLPAENASDTDAVELKSTTDEAIDPEVVEVISRNARFFCKREPVVYPVAREDDFGISAAVDVMAKAPESMEARAQEVAVIARALVSCFPRVAASALDDLALKVSNAHAFSDRIWPAFVNSTRVCYQLFKALALPVSPSPLYTLELLARGWRRVNVEAVRRFIPMSTGGFVNVSREHYARHIMGPVNTLTDLNLISESERDMMTKVLSKGILPCFAGEGDSVPDRLVSFTVALTFAACGQRALGLDDEDDGDHPTVTSAGLLYFAAWYVLVYMGTVHIEPTLKERLSRRGSDADKHLCAALNLKRVTGGSADYKVFDYDGKEIVRALRIVLGDLLDIGTILRSAQLYVPELLMQLPYAKKLNWTPASVKSALESRDVWFAREHRDGLHLGLSEPPFEYIGNLANGLHSSIEGTLTRHHTRPIAQPPHGPDSEFDPWCDTLWVDGEGIDDILRASIESEETYEDLYVDCSSPGDGAQTASEPDPREASSHTTSAHETGERSPRAPESHVNDRRGLLLRKGLLMDIHNLGFQTGIPFLTMQPQTPGRQGTLPGTPLVLKSPCMTNIASTVYTRSQVDTEGMGMPHRDSCQIRTLIEALWVLVHSKAGPSAEEPSTPAALAVMVHLAAKRCDNDSLAACNDIQRVRGVCHADTDFIPIAAIVGGLFGVNVELQVLGNKYQVHNVYYNQKWAPESIVWDGSHWYVSGVNIPIPQEEKNVDCHQSDTLCAYMRLNDLKVVKVPSDNYCGFHTVAVLLWGQNSSCKSRREMVSRTADYMMRNKDNDDLIRVYLETFVDGPDSRKAVELLLTKENRWLTVDEVSFILKVYGKHTAVITEHSYPIYNPECTHVLITGGHYQPVLVQ